MSIIARVGCGANRWADDHAPACRRFISKADVLTDGTARQILAHDETGAKLCGWK
jgi:hypothetical protein